eukprot:2883306-Rhodomonas_salina.1
MDVKNLQAEMSFKVLMLFTHSKSILEGASLVLADRLSPPKVTVNAVFPGRASQPRVIWLSSPVNKDPKNNRHCTWFPCRLNAHTYSYHTDHATLFALLLLTPFFCSCSRASERRRRVSCCSPLPVRSRSAQSLSAQASGTCPRAFEHLTPRSPSLPSQLQQGSRRWGVPLDESARPPAVEQHPESGGGQNGST